MPTVIYVPDNAPKMRAVDAKSFVAWGVPVSPPDLVWAQEAANVASRLIEALQRWVKSPQVEKAGRLCAARALPADVWAHIQDEVCAAAFVLRKEDALARLRACTTCETGCETPSVRGPVAEMSTAHLFERALETAWDEPDEWRCIDCGDYASAIFGKAMQMQPMFLYTFLSGYGLAPQNLKFTDQVNSTVRIIISHSDNSSSIDGTCLAGTTPQGSFALKQLRPDALLPPTAHDVAKYKAFFSKIPGMDAVEEEVEVGKAPVHPRWHPRLLLWQDLTEEDRW
ncbi:hypothetical protein JCM10449v2_000439 [Rhodotorula kratochvilovae]